MKLRYIGGNIETVNVRTNPKVPNQTREEKRDQLTQMLEGIEYVWPEPGAVLVVDSKKGGWLLGKQKKFLEELPHDPAESNTAPNRIVAVVPREAAKTEEKPARPTVNEKPAK